MRKGVLLVSRSKNMDGFRVYDTVIGSFKIGYSAGHITALKKMFDEQISDIGSETRLTKEAYIELTEYLDGRRKTFDVPYKLEGTEFQKKVWKALLEVPYGDTRSYKDIARAIGDENLSRAVGMANNKNPINIIVPCHRVIGSSGKILGYSGGVEMKKFLLDIELRNK